jgi:1-acyl-sn-glycerol-3-phosphate acyltransferase
VPAVLQGLAKKALKGLGWRLIEPPDRPSRMVIVAYPHTSNWDAFYALLTGLALGLRANWAAKDTLFVWPLGPLLKRLGGIPVNRRQRTGFVEQMTECFAQDERCILIMAPEGTRRRTEGWKSGFYRIALAAKVPLALAFVDYRQREAGVLAYFTPSGDPQTDIAAIASHYTNRLGKYPELASPIRWPN